MNLLKHVCKFEHPFVQFKFSVYGHKQASRHTHARAQCSHASVGLAQARSNKIGGKSHPNIYEVVEPFKTEQAATEVTP